MVALWRLIVVAPIAASEEDDALLQAKSAGVHDNNVVTADPRPSPDDPVPIGTVPMITFPDEPDPGPYYTEGPGSRREDRQQARREDRQQARREDRQQARREARQQARREGRDHHGPDPYHAYYTGGPGGDHGHGPYYTEGPGSGYGDDSCVDRMPYYCIQEQAPCNLEDGAWCIFGWDFQPVSAGRETRGYSNFTEIQCAAACAESSESDCMFWVWNEDSSHCSVRVPDGGNGGGEDFYMCRSEMSVIGPRHVDGENFGDHLHEIREQHHGCPGDRSFAENDHDNDGIHNYHDTDFDGHRGHGLYGHYGHHYYNGGPGGDHDHGPYHTEGPGSGYGGDSCVDKTPYYCIQEQGPCDMNDLSGHWCIFGWDFQPMSAGRETRGYSNFTEIECAAACAESSESDCIFWVWNQDSLHCSVRVPEGGNHGEDFYMCRSGSSVIGPRHVDGENFGDHLHHIREDHHGCPGDRSFAENDHDNDGIHNYHDSDYDGHRGNHGHYGHHYYNGGPDGDHGHGPVDGGADIHVEGHFSVRRVS